MANSNGISNSFKYEVMLGTHQLGANTINSRGSLTSPAVDTVKASLYLASATTGPSNTAYTATGEVSGAGYSAGGVTVTNAVAPSLDTATGIWTPSASINFGTVTLATLFDCVMLYNSTQSNKAIGTYTFGGQTVTAAPFTISMPANAAATAVVRIA